jgi:hypothetical protein
LAGYIRFVVPEIDPGSERESGVFQAAYRLRDAGALHAYEDTLLREHLDWFDKNLKKPTSFTTAKRPSYRRQQRAISWFKETASEHISKLREMVMILEDHGVVVRMIKVERPGYIVYEDDHQVVAEPFADSKL